MDFSSHGKRRIAIVGASVALCVGLIASATTYAQAAVMPDMPGMGHGTTSTNTKADAWTVNLHNQVLDFCRTNNTATLKAKKYIPGTNGAGGHWIVDNRAYLGWNPANPKMALVHNNTIVGVVFTGRPTLNPHPNVGTMPHGMKSGTGSSEMIHVYCVTDIVRAFTMDTVTALRDASDPQLVTFGGKGTSSGGGGGGTTPTTTKPPVTTPPFDGNTATAAQLRVHIDEQLRGITSKEDLLAIHEYLHDTYPPTTATTVKPGKPTTTVKPGKPTTTVKPNNTTTTIHGH